MHNSAVGGDGARLRVNQSARFVNRMRAPDRTEPVALHVRPQLAARASPTQQQGRGTDARLLPTGRQAKQPAKVTHAAHESFRGAAPPFPESFRLSNVARDAPAAPVCDAQFGML